MKSRFYAIIYILFIIVITIICSFLLYKNITIIQKYKELNSKVERCQKDYNILTREYNQLEKKLSEYQNLSTSTIDLSATDIICMKKKGINDPVQNLIKDLKEHPEIIPYEGTLGGQMNFYFEKKIWILTNKWVLAYFEDGHIGGYLLLQYNINNAGKISWELISSYQS